jgi:hypothetical protein
MPAMVEGVKGTGAPPMMRAGVAARRRDGLPSAARRVAAGCLLCAFALAVAPAIALEEADEPPDAVAPPAASVFVDVCRHDAEACQLLVRMLVERHLMLREFEEHHARFCLSEADVSSGRARAAILGMQLPAGDGGLDLLEARLAQRFPCED